MEPNALEGVWSRKVGAIVSNLEVGGTLRELRFEIPV